jgi:hypothetical protein
LDQEGLERELQSQIARMGSRYVHNDTYILVDPSDISKPYAEKMQYLATVRDGSSGELRQGYWLCHLAATELSKHRVVPLYNALYSAEAPDFDSKNQQILRTIDTVRGYTGNRSIYVMVRGGDRQNLLEPFLARRMRFIVRQVGNRDFMVRGQERRLSALAKGCRRYCSARVVLAAR